MSEYRILLTKQAKKDLEKICSVPSLKSKVRQLTSLLTENPFANPPRYEKLVGDLDGLFSRRINIQHRLVYEVREEDKAVVIFRMWTHYDD